MCIYMEFPFFTTGHADNYLPGSCVRCEATWLASTRFRNSNEPTPNQLRLVMEDTTWRRIYRCKGANPGSCTLGSTGKND